MAIKSENIVKFLPLLVLYSLLFFLEISTDFYEKYTDEGRYIEFADNLTRGYYTDKDNVFLENGPGYPLLLLPFRALDIPLFFARFLNVILLFASVLYMYKILELYIDRKSSVMVTYLFGLYPLFLLWLPIIYTEVFSIFLIAGFIYHYVKFIKADNPAHLLLASFYIAFLILTRTAFGYVILGLFLFLVVIFLLRKELLIKRTIFVLALGITFCIPYLIYTYSITGKYFYFSTNGGQVLYWMSTPYDNEFGDWISEMQVEKNPQLKENHGDFFNSLKGLSELQKDEMFRKKAIENIKNYPGKYFNNWLANIGRIFFNYPNSYTQQKTSSYFYIIPNMIIVFFLIISLYAIVKNLKKIPGEILVLILLGTIYLGASSLVSATPRYFSQAIPIVFIVIAFSFSHLLSIKFEKNS